MTASGEINVPEPEIRYAIRWWGPMDERFRVREVSVQPIVAPSFETAMAEAKDFCAMRGIKTARLEVTTMHEIAL